MMINDIRRFEDKLINSLHCKSLYLGLFFDSIFEGEYGQIIYIE